MSSKSQILYSLYNLSCLLMLFFFSSYSTKTGQYLRTNESCADLLSYIVHMATCQVPGVFLLYTSLFLQKSLFFFHISFLEEFNPFVPSITNLYIANVRLESITIFRLRLTCEKEKRRKKVSNLVNKSTSLFLMIICSN